MLKFLKEQFEKVQNEVLEEPSLKKVKSLVRSWEAMLGSRGVQYDSELHSFLEYEAANHLRSLTELRFWRAYTMLLLEESKK